MPVPKLYNETEVLQRVPANISDGSKNVTTAGTRVQLTATSTACIYVLICAKPANTDYIYVGGNTVSSTSGIPIAALEKVRIDVDDLSDVYIDSSVSGEGVLYTYVY